MYPHTDHQANQPILDVQHLSFRYNGHFALEDINFHLHKGERIAVVGPNGAGKSTLFKAVSGVLPPTSGEVNIFGSRPADMFALPTSLNGVRWIGTFPLMLQMS
jgi:ABC-type cobalamin/Fe3+-siderophores transport system ATPase subunit